MKGIWFSLALLLMLAFVLSGCGASEESTALTTPIPIDSSETPATSPTFSEALDENGMAPGLTSKSFQELVGSWTHEGKPLADLGQVAYGCGMTFGLSQFEADGICRWEDDYRISDDDAFELRSRLCVVFQPLDGVVMPYDMTFESTLEDLLVCLGYQNDLLTEGEVLLDHTQRTDYDAKLFLIARKDADGLLDYSLRFEESFTSDRYSEGNFTYYTRTLLLGFEIGTNELNYVSFETVEKEILCHTPPAELPSFSQALDQNGIGLDASKLVLTEFLEKMIYEGIPLIDRLNDEGSDDGADLARFAFREDIVCEWFCDKNDGEEYCSFYFSEPLGGFAMPYGMTFVHKLDDLLSVFDAEKVDGEWSVTLGSDDSGVISLYDYHHAPDTVTRPGGVRYAVGYSRDVSICSDSGGCVEYTQEMTLFFDEDTAFLTAVSILIKEKHK